MLDIDGCKRTMASIRWYGWSSQWSLHSNLSNGFYRGLARSWELHHARLKTDRDGLCIWELAMVDNVWWCWLVTLLHGGWKWLKWSSATSHVVLMPLSVAAFWKVWSYGCRFEPHPHSGQAVQIPSNRTDECNPWWQSTLDIAPMTTVESEAGISQQFAKAHSIHREPFARIDR